MFYSMQLAHCTQSARSGSWPLESSAVGVGVIFIRDEILSTSWLRRMKERMSLSVFHLFDDWSNGAGCAGDDRARSEMYKPEESWWKHELVMRNRDGSHIIWPHWPPVIVTVTVTSSPINSIKEAAEQPPKMSWRCVGNKITTTAWRVWPVVTQLTAGHTK
jgi:hypothetical protein